MGFRLPIPGVLAKVLIFAIGTIMWIWMKGYVTVQVTLYGRDILTPLNRTVPPEFSNSSFGNHTYVDVNNISVHYMTKGCNSETANKTIVILLHGFLDFWYIWNYQIPYLSSKFCVVAPDLRGYGNTSKPNDSSLYLMNVLVEDLKQFIEIINPNNRSDVILVGHDWGGMISFVFATLYESLIKKMIIINGMHPWAFRRRLLESFEQMKMSWYMLPFRKPSVPEQYLIMYDFRFFDKIHKNAFTPEEENATKYIFSLKDALTSALNYYRAFNNDSDQLNKFPYRKINVTALILWGEQDEFISTPVADYNQEYLNESSVVYYPGAGHWVQRECSAQINLRIQEFINDENLNLGQPELILSNEVQRCKESLTPSGNPPANIGLPGTLENVTISKKNITKAILKKSRLFT